MIVFGKLREPLRSAATIFKLGLTMLALAAVLFPQTCHGQFVMMPDSTGNRLVLFNPFDGSVANSNLFGLQAGTPIHAIQVNNEIWVSEQLGDRISRWSYTGSLLGNIGGQFAGGGLDNVRGMALIGNTVYLSNSGTANNAPGPGILRFDTSGNNLGSFSTAGTSPSPFAILPYQGGMLVASSSAGNDVHQYDISGNSIGLFHDSTTLNFAQQMAYRGNGNILVSGFSPPSAIYELDALTGSIVNTFGPSGGMRGVYQLGNGNILWSNGSGAHVLDPTTNVSTQVFTGGGRHFSFVDFNVVPEPSSSISVLLLILMGLRRPCRKELI